MNARRVLGAAILCRRPMGRRLTVSSLDGGRMTFERPTAAERFDDAPCTACTGWRRYFCGLAGGMTQFSTANLGNEILTTMYAPWRAGTLLREFEDRKS